MVTSRVAFSVLAAMSLFGCGSREMRAELTQAQRTLVSDASEKLREEFNNGSCEAIEDGAAKAFKQDQGPGEWLRRCEDLRASLGPWQIFKTRSAQSFVSLKGIVIVEGPAVFAKASKEMMLEWGLENGGAELMRFSIKQADGVWVSVPQVPRPVLWDPPMKPLTVTKGLDELFG